MVGLSALQVGPFSILFATAFHILIDLRRTYRLKKGQWKWIVIYGFLGSFFPVFLFALAETEIDSAAASILNATTPLMPLIFGVLFFGILDTQNKITGVVIGLLGAIGLIFSGVQVNPDQNYLYAGLVVIAAGCYAVNVNIIKK